MNQQPDKFIREKLDKFVQPISDNAWSRIERKLDKKTNWSIWTKIAASFLIVCAASLTIWLLQKQPDPIEHTISTNHTNPTSSLDTASQNEENNVKEKVSTPKVKKTKQKNIQNKTTTTSPPEEEIENIFSENELKYDVNKIETHYEESLTHHPTLEDTSKYKLVLLADAVNEKYLDKKSLSDATSSEKKSSTIKKLLNKAYELKTNQDTYGDLRQMKNEILALEFRNEKKKIQNKQ